MDGDLMRIGAAAARLIDEASDLGSAGEVQPWEPSFHLNCSIHEGRDDVPPTQSRPRWPGPVAREGTLEPAQPGGAMLVAWHVSAPSPNTIVTTSSRQSAEMLV